jgi:hypothetical protein
VRDRKRRSEKGPHQFCTKSINPIASAHSIAYCKENDLPPTVSSTIRPHTDYSDHSCWMPRDNLWVAAVTRVVRETAAAVTRVVRETAAAVTKVACETAATGEIPMN